jgi:hypothetical protein
VTRRQDLGGAYPEIGDRVLRLLRACESGDRFEASAHTWLLDSDVKALLGASHTDAGLPDLLAETFGELADLAAHARRFDQHIRSVFQASGIDLCELDSLQQLARRLERG